MAILSSAFRRLAFELLWTAGVPGAVGFEAPVALLSERQEEAAVRVGAAGHLK